MVRHKGTWREEECSIDGCKSLCHNKTLMICEMHYIRHLKGSPPMRWPAQCRNKRKDGTYKKCKISGCDRDAVKQMMCHTHYNRDMWDRDMTKPIPYRKPYKKRSK